MNIEDEPSREDLDRAAKLEKRRRWLVAGLVGLVFFSIAIAILV